MKSGYKVYWTGHALNELEKTIEYLEENFSVKEIQNLARKIESVTELIARNPELFAKSEASGIHKAIILKYNTLYYRVKGRQVEILSFFSNRQHPEKIKR